MKQWTGDLIIGAVIAATLGTLIALTQSGATFVLFIAGLASGYGLRIGIVNVWPHVFRPRIAYKRDRVNSSRKLRE
jgi:hypothetical protein